MRKVVLLCAVGLIGVLGVAAMAFADGGNGSRSFSTKLNGWEEDPSQVTTGFGSFSMRVVSPIQIAFTLRWEQLEGDVTQAHIHIGSFHESGGISAWLCAPPQPACPPGRTFTVTGTIDPQDITGPAGQGVEPANFADLLRAVRAGEAYVNVHTTRAGGGEIRGQFGDGGDDDDD